MTSEAQLFFESIQNFMETQEMQKKVAKRFLDFQIITFELLASNTRSY